jgi:hypothetical protein
VIAGSAAVVAHGVGGRQDLPIPYSYAVAGALAAVIVSFVALGVLWRTPRLRGAEAGRPLPTWLARILDSTGFAIGLRLLGLVIFGWILVAALLGPDDALNPTAGFVYVLLWVGGCVVASLILGPVIRALNPLRTVHLVLARVTRRDPDQGLMDLPERWGRWPAAVWLLAFLWLELAAPDRATLPVLTRWFAVYLVVTFALAVLFGARWFAVGDPFEVYSTMVARLAPFGRRSDGVLVARNPLDGVEGTPSLKGDAGVALVLLGGTLFDGLSNAPQWVRVAQDPAYSAATAATVGLVLCIVAVSGVYLACTALAGRIARLPRSAHVPRALSASLVPIVIGYAIAHYYSLLVIVGQQTVQNMSDPLGTGADLLGVAGNGVSYTWVQPTTVATVQVLAVVIGHIGGVFAAHERGVRLFPASRAVAAQVPLLVAMVVFTFTGLTLLFAG